VVLCAFDLLELDGHDLRWAPVEEQKATLAKLLRRPIEGIAFNEHYSGDGAIIYRHDCALGCEGIVSKRLGSPYRSGRAVSWLKIKEPGAPAVRREAEEEWNRSFPAGKKRSAPQDKLAYVGIRLRLPRATDLAEGGCNANSSISRRASFRA
jgi:hypothetical protein